MTLITPKMPFVRAVQKIVQKADLKIRFGTKGIRLLQAVSERLLIDYLKKLSLLAANANRDYIMANRAFT